MKDILNNLHKSATWEIKLTMSSSCLHKDTDEEQVVHSKSNNIETMINDEAYEVIKKPFESILSRYQIGLETTMKGKDFVFDYVDLLY